MKRLPRVRRHHVSRWLPIALMVTLVMGFVYLALQQHIRAEADQPQVAMAQDAVDQLTSGVTPAKVVAPPVYDITKTLSPFVIIYDSHYMPVAGNAILDGQLPIVPSGSLAYSATHDDNRVTWQPTDSIRIAAVIRSYTNQGKIGYVLAGRNLQEPERQESQLTAVMLAGWFIVLVSSLGLVILIEAYHDERTS